MKLICWQSKCKPCLYLESTPCSTNIHFWLLSSFPPPSDTPIVYPPSASSNTALQSWAQPPCTPDLPEDHFFRVLTFLAAWSVAFLAAVTVVLISLVLLVVEEKVADSSYTRSFNLPPFFSLESLLPAWVTNQPLRITTHHNGVIIDGFWYNPLISKMTLNHTPHKSAPEMGIWSKRGAWWISPSWSQIFFKDWSDHPDGNP